MGLYICYVFQNFERTRVQIQDRSVSETARRERVSKLLDRSGQTAYPATTVAIADIFFVLVYLVSSFLRFIFVSLLQESRCVGTVHRRLICSKNAQSSMNRIC